MQKKALPTLLLIATLGVIASHLDWSANENGQLLLIDNRPIDLVGLANNAWVRLSRNCSSVSVMSKDGPQFQQSIDLIKSYSPPDSNSAKVASLIGADNWSLAEVEFDSLLPAVVLIKRVDKELAIVPNGIWSGYTKPWESAPYIRNYLTTQVPGVPRHLTDCFEPSSQSFK